MTGSIISYFPISTDVGSIAAGTFGPLVNHRFGCVYTQYQGNASNCGVRRHDAWPNGSELFARNLASIGLPNVFSIYTPWTLTYNTQFVALSSGPSNSSAIIYLNQRDVSYAGEFGVISSDLSPSDGPRMLAAAAVCAIQQGGNDFIVATTVTESFEVVLVNINAGICGVLGLMTEARGVVGALPDGSGTHAFVLGHNPDDSTQPLTLYTATVAALTANGTILPSQIDATWSHVDATFGCAVDQTDGNPIVGVQNLTDTVTHNAYLVKLNATTGAVMWTCAPPGAFALSPGDLQQALITQQKLYYLASNNTTATIDTATGAIIENLPFSDGALSTAHPSQISEDVTGSIYYMGGWAENNTHPAYYGSWMGTGGNHTIANAPIRWFPDTAAPSPPAPPAPPNTSRARAWTFQLDGHKFYVLDLGTQGTLLYDITTKSWAQFVTTGYWNWNFRNGCMWNQRIVGGDTDTPQIWEMSPSSMKDNDTLDITHIVSGALVKRTRTYTSQAALRLAVSTGQLDDSTGANVVLSFSDDQGKTWTTMNAIALDEDNFNQELAWQGLGAFAAPGRIFQITDIGGFVRIDGCDAELDDFDEDGNAQARESDGG